MLIFACIALSVSADKGSYSDSGSSYSSAPTAAPTAPSICVGAGTSKQKCEVLAGIQEKTKVTEGICEWDEDTNTCEGHGSVAIPTMAPTSSPTKAPTMAPTSGPTSAPSAAYTIQTVLTYKGYTKASFGETEQNALRKSLSRFYGVEESRIELQLRDTTIERRLETGLAVTAIITADSEEAAVSLTSKTQESNVASKIFESFKTNLVAAGDTVPVAASITSIAKPTLNGAEAPAPTTKKSSSFTLIIGVVCAVLGALFIFAVIAKMRTHQKTNLTSPVVQRGGNNALTRSSLHQGNTLDANV